MIHEDQLLNFLINRLDKEIDRGLTDNVQMTSKDIYGHTLARVPMRPQSPHSVKRAKIHLIQTRFCTIFARSSTLKHSNASETSCSRGVSSTLPKQVEVVCDLHLRPYYYDDEIDGLYHSEAKRGTTAFHIYATLAYRHR